MIARINASSKESIRVEVSAYGVSNAVLASFPVQMAFMPRTVDVDNQDNSPENTMPGSGDWKTASWPSPNDPTAECQIGPGSVSAAVLTSGIFYDVWIKINPTGPNPDSPVLLAGTLKVV